MDLFTVTGDGPTNIAGPFQDSVNIAPVGEPIEFDGAFTVIEYSDVNNDSNRWANSGVSFGAASPEGKVVEPGGQFYIRGVTSGSNGVVNIPYMSTDETV